MDRSTLAVLRRHNPWLENPSQQALFLQASLPPRYVVRTPKLEPTEGRLSLVIGPRQAGKSTWIREELAQIKDPILLLHGEEPLIQALCRSPALLFESLAPLLSPKTLIFFEEVQQLPNAALFLKGLVDLEPHRIFVATGSSSFQLHSKTRESLAGRAKRKLFLPFSLREVESTLPVDLLPAIAEEKRRTFWEKMVLFGGYPAVWLSDDPTTVLTELVEAFVLKDASDLYHLDNPEAFRKVLRLCAADIGNLLNISTLAAACGISRDTVSRYLEIAEDAHVLRRVASFAGGKRAELTGSDKIFFIDNGLRNTLFGGFGALNDRADLGALFENAVYTELLKRLELLDEIFFWRSKNKAEVDFVLQRREMIIGIEVKAARFDKPQLTRSAHSFIEAYAPKHFAVINAGLRADQEIGNTQILFRRPWEIGDLLF
jgi:predicted AAA+ superfamily ATPase